MATYPPLPVSPALLTTRPIPHPLTQLHTTTVAPLSPSPLSPTGSPTLANMNWPDSGSSSSPPLPSSGTGVKVEDERLKEKEVIEAVLLEELDEVLPVAVALALPPSPPPVPILRPLDTTLVALVLPPTTTPPKEEDTPTNTTTMPSTESPHSSGNGGEVVTPYLSPSKDKEGVTVAEVMLAPWFTRACEKEGVEPEEVRAVLRGEQERGEEEFKPRSESLEEVMELQEKERKEEKEKEEQKPMFMVAVTRPTLLGENEVVVVKPEEAPESIPTLDIEPPRRASIKLNTSLPSISSSSLYSPQMIFSAQGGQFFASPLPLSAITPRETISNPLLLALDLPSSPPPPSSSSIVLPVVPAPTPVSPMKSTTSSPKKEKEKEKDQYIEDHRPTPPPSTRRERTLPSASSGPETVSRRSIKPIVYKPSSAPTAVVSPIKLTESTKPSSSSLARQSSASPTRQILIARSTQTDSDSDSSEDEESDLPAAYIASRYSTFLPVSNASLVPVSKAPRSHHHHQQEQHVSPPPKKKESKKEQQQHRQHAPAARSRSPIPGRVSSRTVVSHLPQARSISLSKPKAQPTPRAPSPLPARTNITLTKVMVAEDLSMGELVREIRRRLESGEEGEVLGWTLKGLVGGWEEKMGLRKESQVVNVKREGERRSERARESAREEERRWKAMQTQTDSESELEEIVMKKKVEKDLARSRTTVSAPSASPTLTTATIIPPPRPRAPAPVPTDTNTSSSIIRLLAPLPTTTGLPPSPRPLTPISNISHSYYVYQSPSLSLNSNSPPTDFTKALASLNGKKNTVKTKTKRDSPPTTTSTEMRRTISKPYPTVAPPHSAATTAAVGAPRMKMYKEVLGGGGGGGGSRSEKEAKGQKSTKKEVVKPAAPTTTTTSTTVLAPKPRRRWSDPLKSLLLDESVVEEPKKSISSTVSLKDKGKGKGKEREREKGRSETDRDGKRRKELSTSSNKLMGGEKGKEKEWQGKGVAAFDFDDFP